MQSLTANDLKTRGVSAIEESLATQPEAVISVRGKERYVVMEVAQYHYLRECELDAALAQSTADIEAGLYIQESAQQHLARIAALLAEDAEDRTGTAVAFAPGREQGAMPASGGKPGARGRKKSR
jgi:hypothetical protein